MRKNKSVPKSKEFHFSPDLKDLPATQGMLKLVRAELKSEMKAGFRQVDAKFEQVFSEMSGLRAEVKIMSIQTDSKLEHVLSEVARIGVLVEEQNSRNRIVMEGLTGLWQRQERVESRSEETEKLVRSLARAKS